MERKIIPTPITLLSSVKEIKIIKVVTKIGNGTSENPYREVIALYQLDGKLITTLDNFKEDTL